MKAIITGITGQDGSHLADFLLEKGYDVVGVRRRSSTDNRHRIKHLLDHPNFELVSGDITDPYSIISILEKHSDDMQVEFYNLGAQSHVAESFKQPAATWDVTGKGPLNVLEAIQKLGLEHIRFYQASSSEMYGKNYDIGRSQNKFQNEETKFMPQSPYAIAKCAAHYMTRLFREAYGLHASAGILFNHEGERRGETFVTRKITKWIGDFMAWCKEKEVSPSDLACDKDEVYIPGRVNKDQGFQFPKLRLGNLDAYRDWGYAGDYVEAMWMMLQQPEPDDYVICTGKSHTIRELLDVVFQHIEIDDWAQYVVVDPEFYRPAEVDYLRGDNTKAKEKLGWEPKTSFEELVKLMVDHDIKLAKR